ncbi:Urease accessory protein UreE [Metallosphaera sp. J1]|uniref:urease accessory protein UreE n=1 Tax=Metallosphaera TaxID=41980 RepID=UPI001EDD5C20|nr:hypothetical protein [Metallosphaera javensis (ex Hofmann et al. 2022)]MCG3109594.1 Urease accessory protein UreE [Metallosphaera javensis (ex Hofmann et al. 2022)]BCS93099.1 MAG: urease accessory protein UreE [Metallosphaera javensis (ex Sakai et al. 2022)]
MENVVKVNSIPDGVKVHDLVTDRRSIEMGRVKVNLEDGMHVISVKGLRDGDVFLFKDRYWRLVQMEEKVLHISLTDSVEGFRIGFAVGNLHMKAMISGKELYIPFENPNLPNLLASFNPRIEVTKFIPNVEIPIEGDVVQFVADH